MSTQIIVINGGSSSGKTGIARCLKAILPELWLSFSVDDLIAAMPAKQMDSDGGVKLGEGGEVSLGDDFRTAERAWTTGIAAMAREGVGIILDDVFLSGQASQDRVRAHFEGLEVLWVGVHCDAEVAAAREMVRGDRVLGMAAMQAELAHKGVVYDVEVDSTHTEALDCARIIAEHVR